MVLQAIIRQTKSEEPTSISKGADAMGSSGTIQPILGEQSLLLVGAGILAIFIAAGISFTVILRHDPSKIEAFRGGRALHYITIVVIVFATALLALEHIVSGEAVSNIFGGIIGYVLGTLRGSDTAVRRSAE